MSVISYFIISTPEIANNLTINANTAILATFIPISNVTIFRLIVKINEKNVGFE